MKKFILATVISLLTVVLLVVPCFAAGEDDEYITEKIGDFETYYSDGAGTNRVDVFFNGKHYSSVEARLKSTGEVLNAYAPLVAVLKSNGNPMFTKFESITIDFTTIDLSSFYGITLDFFGCGYYEDISVTVYGKRKKTYQDGYTAGQTVGYTEGYEDGEVDGESAGYNKGYTAGTKRTDGYQAAKRDVLTSANNLWLQYVVGMSGYPEGYEFFEIDDILSGTCEYVHNSAYVDGIEFGRNSGYSLGYSAGHDEGYTYGYNAGKTENSMTEYANAIDKNEGTLIQGFLAGMWNGATNFIQPILNGVTFSGLSLMTILATAFAILVAAFIIKIIRR